MIFDFTFALKIALWLLASAKKINLF